MAKKATSPSRSAPAGIPKCPERRGSGEGLRLTTTSAWTGGTGGKLAAMVDFAFVVPSKVTARIQESHITLGHVLCELTEEELLGKAS